jgi:hypothetical protein
MQYFERVQESQAFIAELLPLAPEAISVELIDEAHRIVDAEPKDTLRQHMAQELQLICDPEAREAARHVQRDVEHTTELESWLAEVSIGGLGAGSEEDYGDVLSDERAAEWEEAKAEAAARRTAHNMSRVDQILRGAKFGVDFGESEYGQPWRDIDTVEAVRDVMRIERELGHTITGDSVRELLTRVEDKNGPQFREALELLVVNADQANDRESFLAANERFQSMATSTLIHNVLPIVKPLVAVAIKFIEAGKPANLDREALDIALEALPYYDRTSGYYPLLMARLGVSLQGFDK